MSHQSQSVTTCREVARDIKKDIEFAQKRGLLTNRFVDLVQKQALRDNWSHEGLAHSYWGHGGPVTIDFEELRAIAQR